jgi:hypothetical protein
MTAETASVRTADTGAEPAITCSSCRYFHLNHQDLPDYRCTGHHGLCISPLQSRHVQHEDSVRCAWWEQREERGGEEAMPVTRNGIAQHLHCLALLDLANEELIGDEELIAEIERRGYRVHCPEVPCPECGTMCSVPPGEAGQTVTCDFCGESIDTAPFLFAERGSSDALIAGAA